MQKTNIITGLLAIVMTILMLPGSVVGLTSNSANTINAKLGENVKLRIGQTLDVEELNIYLGNIISSSTADSALPIVDMYDTASLVLSLEYSDTTPTTKYSLTLGESLEYNEYVIELTDIDITAKAIGIIVSKGPATVSTMNTAGFNELFKIKTGEEYNISGKLKFKLIYVLSPGALGSPGQGLVGITVVENTNVADVAPTSLRFDSIPETKKYGDYLIILEDRRTDSAVFKVIRKANLSTGTPAQTVTFEEKTFGFGEKFKGSVGSTFRVGSDYVKGVFEVKITSINYDPYTDVIPSASVNVRYEGPPTASEITRIEKSFNYTLAVNENKWLPYNHKIELLEIDTNSAVFVIGKKVPIITVNNNSGIDLATPDAIVTATQIRIEPGARSLDVRSRSGVVNVDSEMLVEGIDISVSPGNAVKVRTDSDKLETYLDDGNVTVRTRTTLKSNSKGIFVETESADVKLKVLPATASKMAKEVIAANFNEFSLEEIEGKIVYRADGKKKFLVLGIFPVEGDVEVTIDAETGAVINTDKPWYAAISR